MRTLAAFFVVCACFVLVMMHFGPAAELREVEVLIESDPPKATLFHEQGGCTATPCRLTLRPGEPRTVRLVRKDHMDAEITLRAEDYQQPAAEGHRVVVTLTSVREARLVVTTRPEGAEVVLDGVRMGVTPLVRDNLAPGRHAIHLAHAEGFPIKEQILLQPGETLTIDRVMESRNEALYRGLIAREPHMMNHYAELAHHHVLKGQFPEAIAALEMGVNGLRLKDAVDQKRYWTEIQRIYTRYYVYPPDPDNVLRPALRRLVDRLEAEKMFPANLVKSMRGTMDRYDRTAADRAR